MKDEIVFGWAMHYFEENEIIGTLYNEDGTEYKPTPKKASKPIQRVPAPTIFKKPEPKVVQFSFFDTPTEKDIPNETEPLVVDEETGEILHSETQPPEKKNVPIQQASPLYQKYMRAQNEYPHAVIAYRLGDFFEVFGDNAVRIAEQFDLTLTGRDCGLKSRVPMIGFPYHAAESYFAKIVKKHDCFIYDLQKRQDRRKNFYHATSLENLRAFVKGETDKFLDYIEKQETNYYTYNDYKRACEYLGIDMTEDKNRYPHDFNRWHDIRIDEYHIEVGNDEKFLDGDIPKTSPDTEHILLRACGMGIPQRDNDIIHVNGKEYVVQ